MFPRLRARYLMLPPFVLSLSKGACRRTILPASEVHVLIRMKWYKSRSWEKPAQGEQPSGKSEGQFQWLNVFTDPVSYYSRQHRNKNSIFPSQGGPLHIKQTWPHTPTSRAFQLLSDPTPPASFVIPAKAGIHRATATRRIGYIRKDLPQPLNPPIPPPTNCARISSNEPISNHTKHKPRNYI